MKDPKTIEEMFEFIKEDCPEDEFNEVLSYKLNDYGFYDVQVDKPAPFFNTKVLHTRMKWPYPYSEYEKLTEKEKLDWRWD